MKRYDQHIRYSKDIIIRGEPTMYLISTWGEVINKFTGKRIKPFYASRGYEYVKLSVNKKKSSYIVHRLVAAAFLDNPNDLPTVNHKVGGIYKTHNTPSNLEYCSYADNNQHAYDTGLKTNYGVNSHFNKYPEELIRDICSDLEDGIDMHTLDSKYDVPFHLVSDLYYRFKWKKVTTTYNFPNNFILNMSTKVMTDKREAILKCIYDGMSNADIIDTLDLSNFKYCESTLEYFRNFK